MDHIASTYSARPNASLASTQSLTASQPASAGRSESSFKPQDNTLNFLLLDATRMYKMAQSTHNKLAPRVEKHDVEYRVLSQKFSAATLELAQQTKDLADMDSSMTGSFEAWGQAIDNFRSDNLKANRAITKNTKDITHLEKRLDMLENATFGLKARQNKTEGLEDQTRVIIRHITPSFEAQRAKYPQPPSMPEDHGPFSHSQVSTAVDSSAAAPADKYRVRGSTDKLHGRTRHTSRGRDSQLTYAPSNNSRARYPVGAYSGYPKAGELDQADEDFLSSTLPAPNQGGQTISTPSKTRMPTEVSARPVTPTTPLKPDHAVLEEYLTQAIKRHSQHPRPRNNKFIWNFLDTFPDKRLSRNLQKFLLRRFDRKLVNKSHATIKQREERNRWICLPKLTWDLFVEGVGEFLQPGRDSA